MLLLDINSIDGVKIGDDVLITFHRLNNKLKIGITAPKNIPVDRIYAKEWEQMTGKKFHYYLNNQRKHESS